MVVGVVPMLLGEIQLSLYLRGDDRNIDGHHKKGEVLENCWSKKNIVISNMTVLWGYGRYWGTAGDALNMSNRHFHDNVFKREERLNSFILKSKSTLSQL